MEVPIDPTLLGPGEQASRPMPLVATDGATASHRLSSSCTVASPSPVPTRPASRYTKDQIKAWESSNFAPRRDANESREEYEERLTLITRKAPLTEACSKLSLAVPKSANLERLRRELATHWFTPLSNSRLPPSQHTALPLPPSTHHRTDEVPNFFPPGNPLQFPPAPGLLPAVSLVSRGEFRASVPLPHVSAATSTHAKGKAPSHAQATTEPPHIRAPSSRLPVAVRTQEVLSLSCTPPPSSSSSLGTPASSRSQQLSAEGRPFFGPQPPPRPRDTTGSMTPRSSTSRRRATADGAPDELLDDIPDLIARFGSPGANAEELMGYDDDPEEDEEEEDEDGGGDEYTEQDIEQEGDIEIVVNGDDTSGVRMRGEGECDEDFERRLRVRAAERFEANRRVGGIRTQKAVVRDFHLWRKNARDVGDITHDIIDERALLLYIEHSATRNKRDRRGQPIPGSRLGASHLKKLYFGVLRMRKLQEANDPKLLQKPAATSTVWDAIKTAMDQALTRVRNGLDQDKGDAPDIRANTFLPEISDDQLEKIGHAFLGHSQQRLAIMGHLSWCAQNATGNRGDDFRALKNAELQPWTMMHPDGRTAVTTVLGLQGEEKAGKRGMRTVVNPSYSVFVAHKNPEICPLGAFAIYMHYIHDVYDITTKCKIDWAWNKSWRQIRVLFGQKSPTTPYSEQALWNLYDKAFKRAGFQSRLKAHLPRHILGYKQEKMNVDAADTSKLGWVRGATYFDTYAPALPKKAILGAAGFKVDESYDPVWTRVPVPQRFLHLICPMAENTRDSIAAKDNLTGAYNYWEMVIDLRQYAFQSGAALFQKCPKSSVFRLPAFKDKDVRNWMMTTFPTELALLQAKSGSPEAILQVENAILRRALEEIHQLASKSDTKLDHITAMIERRTAVLSPAQGFSSTSYHHAVASFSSPATPVRSRALGAATTCASPIIIHVDEQMQETGTYESLDIDGLTTMGAFVNESPKTPGVPREPTQVDLHLPKEAFYKPGEPMGIVPPFFGQKSVRWQDIFPSIIQPHVCWPLWKPKSVDSYTSVDEIWASWIDGAPVVVDGVQKRKNPPLKLAEQYLGNRWRSPADRTDCNAARQHWCRYREIPEWIERESHELSCSPAEVVKKLEAMRVVDGQTKGLNFLQKELADRRKQAAKAARASSVPGSSSSLAGCTESVPDPGQCDSSAQQAGAAVPTRKRGPAHDPRRAPPTKKTKI